MKVRIIVLTSLLLSAVMVTSSYGQDIDWARAAKIKAGCIYQLVQLTKWPEEKFETAESPLVIGVLGKDPYSFAEYFRLQTRFFKVKEHPLDVKSFRWAKSARGKISPALENDLRDCHVLYITAAERAHYVEIIESLGNVSVLTVGETKDFVQKRGMVSFTIEETILVIRVDLEILERKGFEVGAEFLQHARIAEKRNNLSR